MLIPMVLLLVDIVWRVCYVDWPRSFTQFLVMSFLRMNWMLLWCDTLLPLVQLMISCSCTYAGLFITPIEFLLEHLELKRTGFGTLDDELLGSETSSWFMATLSLTTLRKVHSLHTCESIVLSLNLTRHTWSPPVIFNDAEGLDGLGVEMAETVLWNATHELLSNTWS